MTSPDYSPFAHQYALSRPGYPPELFSCLASLVNPSSPKSIASSARAGMLAVWTYHVGYVEPPLDKLFAHFYWDIVSPFFAPGARLVDSRYETITLPGEPIDVGGFFMTASWNLDQMLGFIRSWSGTQRYIQEKGSDPVALILPDLKQLWQGCGRVVNIRWPLYIRASKF